MRNLEEIQHVADNYPTLQGLRLVPFGVLFLLWGLNDLLEIWPDYRLWKPMIDLVVLGAAVAASVAIGRFYYEPRYGRMKPYSASWGLLWIMLGWLVAAPTSWVLMREYQLPFDLFGIVAIAAFGAGWWYLYGPSWYDGVILGGLVFLCILPLFGETPLHGHPDVPAALRIEVYRMSIGFVIIAAGIGAHMHLRKWVPLPMEENPS